MNVRATFVIAPSLIWSLYTTPVGCNVQIGVTFVHNPSIKQLL